MSKSLSVISFIYVVNEIDLCLRAWRDNLYRNRQQILRLGYTEDFFRMWDFYFCYCEGGFTERVISDVQMLLTKPGNRRKPIPRIQVP